MVNTAKVTCIQRPDRSYDTIKQIRHEVHKLKLSELFPRG